MISELNSFLTGWVTYFRYASAKTHLMRLDERIRRKRTRVDAAGGAWPGALGRPKP